MCVIQSGLIQANHHQGWFLFPCLMVIINDTSAYLLGCRWGRRPLFSQSPNKTLEGYLLAIPCTVLLGLVVAAWMGLDSTSSLKIALFASTVAPFAGFFTSALKRARGFKDFGQCLPGHGGLVDRVDCQLFMAVFTFLLING
ncbi:phosphatidate cytidylyltransferase [Sporodiniella umbellata]|nr:phosphatidate cytidylyltransferase [Sporodiniella umbellata]